MRRITREIRVGKVAVGGNNPVVVQSMTNTDTRDIPATIEQINNLFRVGCELIRVAVPDFESAEALSIIVGQSPMPVIADVHFDYRLAIQALQNGADGLRINPGNIGPRWKVEAVIKEARDRNVPIRIGVNAGSLERAIRNEFGGATPEAMVESALRQVRVLEDMGFNLIKISLKSSNVMDTVKAYRLLSDAVDYPLHIGITEAGTLPRGLIKSAMGIGMLLAEGIGDTIRVSLTADPREEVWAAYEILRAAGRRSRGVELVSCPTCGRCEIQLQELAEEVDRELRGIEQPLKVAVMGCVVNGPGEARDADIGIAGGRGFGLLFKGGQVIAKVENNRMASALIDAARETAKRREMVEDDTASSADSEGRAQ
ncbi:MAG: flavodoxin-dependent (E)-4-hydroxy-3-methylbut-2-enyl-diphosphate synthase [Syntrophomonadaceae bacterium]|jgi:(E)-4-hydroxy-3-methylbut-2-enyl-diphosphate synthase|nr:flavodoxin-dependent (E)-4-hydroxy-3-methylbut-2-enyl-diphosphate synthase [Syntrophomonadaceae bacterium]